MSRTGNAALELASACLSASYSLKGDPDEGELTDQQAKLVRGWKRQLAAVGAEQLAVAAREAADRDPVALEPFSILLVDRLIDALSGAGDLAAASDRLTAPDGADPVAALAPWLPADDEPPLDPGAVLAEIRTEYQAADAPGFQPVRPVAPGPADPTRALFHQAWHTMLLALAQSVSADGPDRDAGALVARQLLSSVIRPLGEALARLPAGDGDTGGDRTAPASVDQRLWRMAVDATGLVTNPGLPAEALEAAAALQGLACSSGPDRERRAAELREIMAAAPAGIRSVTNGPYLATNVDDVQTALGEPIPTLPLVAFCRCGQSQRKPFCDGSHARVDFSSRKDPKRVPDRRDTYQGLQATVFDNRGTCAHSGFCTDRLPTGFRAGQEPFVAPSGGRLDEFIQAVRACPSGALSHGIEGQEAREQVDQHRPPRIEVSKDGPYRITGGIPLTDPHGDDQARNAGASREHYSLCRCGQSQNKPFCSGMHWYVDFHDPPPPEEPTLFQWVGGIPALTRMTRLFYSKYVPEDPLLAPLFGSMSPDHPERVAAWLGEVFGGPTFYSERYGGYPRMVSQHIGKEITEDHRSRWVHLMCRSADEAQVPADPEFRAAFVAYLEWGSRLAVENSTVGARPPEGMPVPRWWWVCDATPSARVSAFAAVDEDAEPAPVELPAEGEPVSFERHVKPLFRDRDRRSMRFVFDLWSYDDVCTHGPAILARLQEGSMPCDGAWPAEQVQAFQRWLDTGMSS
jgi:CDGSH-type Zn-finger protein/truncated hemoglobin YjbI